MPDLAEHEERAIRDYVNSQSPQDDKAGLVQRVNSQRILGRVHEVFDVHCAKTRWWVITDPTNLYLQEQFPDAEQALIFHIGLGAVLAERSRGDLPEDDEEHVTAPWRRYRDALTVMDEADEAEDFQSVGIKCRDALIALGKLYQDAEWLGEVPDPPKVADFKGWGALYAERLSRDRVRNYVKALVEKTWDLTVALQHNSNATPADADLVLEATAHLIGTFGRLVSRQLAGEPERCPRCESYRLDEDVEHDAERAGFDTSTVCAACGWRSERVFTSWNDHFEGTDIEAYLAGPGTGVSDGFPPGRG
ncbi:hypothetical protein [Curtobacterium flaccumfaciens]|uniref:hypothetical protein n=1 Tax=Curtobacterium flaccumfaciens TaxID=2035 RepID=UPI00188B3284|nr:hypothetical protein [Curtobacterium flaccumfaciens]MBF4629589.1 hypothetical protein [Curtobacterium flaccumfaciens]